MNKIEIYINDKPYLVEKGRILIEVCRELEIFIPSLCYFPGTNPFAGCRLCIVEIRKGNWHKLVASCEYPLNKTENFYTDSERVKNSRRLSAELLLARVPSAQEFLQDIIQQPLERIFEPIESQNDKCLLCGLCYRACSKFGPNAINVSGRGALKAVTTPYNEANPACVACGICAEICPTNAIKMKVDEKSRTIWQQRSDLIICPKCGKKHITIKTWQFLTEELGLPSEEMLLCEECRKLTIAQSMLTGFRKHS